MLSSASTTTSSHTSLASDSSIKSEFKVLPKCVVFDLDDTLWEGDIDMLGNGPPWKACPLSESEGKGVDGIVSTSSRYQGPDLCLFPDVVDIMTELERTPEVKVAIASCTMAPSWARKALEVFATSNGTPFAKIISSNQSYDGCKKKHITKICQQLHIEPSDIVFYDNLRYNIRDVQSLTSQKRLNDSAIAIYTPQGLDWKNFRSGLVRFEKERSL